MDFDWNNPPFNLNTSLSLKEIEESFEDPFAVRLLPSSSRFSVQARYLNLGVSSSGGRRLQCLSHQRQNLPRYSLPCLRAGGEILLPTQGRSNPRTDMNTFSNWDEVPMFDNEQAEAAFWAENRPDLRLMESAVAVRLRAFRIRHYHLAHRPADAGAHQAARPFPLSELPEHDQAMAQRTDGRGTSGTQFPGQ